MFPSRRTVVDVGMHSGSDSEYYARRGFKVIAYEANPELCQKASVNFVAAGLDVDVRNRAISAREETVAFHINRFNTTWSSLDPELGSRRGGADVIEVSTCRLDRELRDVSEDLHYVKIDIEGFDAIALRQVLALEHPPDFVSVENGSPEMLKALSKAGYAGFKYSNQRYVSLQRIPENSRHGAMIQHTFRSGSSGLFGNDLGGRWLTLDEALAIFDGLAAGRRLAPNNLWAESIGWFDLHAALTGIV